MIDITVFIFNYNGMKYIKNCLDAIDKQTMKHYTIFLDNHSNDGSYEYARNRLGTLACLRNEKNKYICYMQQQAMNLCQTKYAAFCHVDCFPESMWLEKLYKVAENEEAGAVEPEIVHTDGQVLHGTVTRWFTPKLHGKCERYPLIISTCSTLYRKLPQKLFDASYLHYHDETYASEIIKRNGYLIVHEKDCIVHHIGSHSGLVSLKWKALARFNQARLILKFGHTSFNRI